MKVLFFILFCLCAICAPIATPTASADGARFACVQKDCFFYFTPDLENGAFLLPETYFVKILDEKPNYYRIEYLSDSDETQALVGYCRKEKVSAVDYQPTNPYLYQFFDVVYQTDGENGDGFLTQITMTCAYYGDYPLGSTTYCYVLREGEFGYVPKPIGFDYPKNPEYEQNLPTEIPEEESPSSESPSYLPFIALALLSPAAAYLIFKSTSKKPFEPEEEKKLYLISLKKQSNCLSFFSIATSLPKAIY